MHLVNLASDNNRLAGDRPPHYGKKDDFPRQEVPNLGNLGNEALARLCSWRSPDRQRDKIRRSCSTGRGVTRSGDLVLQGAVVNSCVLASFRVCAVVNRAHEYPCVFLRVRGCKPRLPVRHEGICLHPVNLTPFAKSYIMQQVE